MKLMKLISSDKILLGLVGLVAVGMSFIYLGKGAVTPPQSIQAKSAATASLTTNSRISALEKELESKLQANILQMEGAGKVQVSVSFSTGLKTEYARNQNVTKSTTKETDKTGGTRETTAVTDNNQVVMPSGSSQPVMVMEDRPEVAGVLIIAEGARDPKVREEIHTAVQTLLNIPSARITVRVMGGP
ncbi:stage III sporulation protein AH [Desulfosporosinus metallidurans]|uniref:Stage III sporulation protein AG n=1 Tax=Desulfosporosinus metallidurans TaxID=1888891 RepID=A0A1Q8QXU1_9FIRM|nr:stage III sporulation protein AH [Desulfosporosinus metallidurans]OLN32199.1 Stage III sporulation protein AG [Desulfosporosinus metallidurans]